MLLHTNDKIIRKALRDSLSTELAEYCKRGYKAEIIEELGIRHGTARIDFAVINGIMHGYEIKSDRDTLDRLPEQVEEFNAVFDKLTVVVGKCHLYQAIHIVPDWWGIMLAKFNDSQLVVQVIREPEYNREQVALSIARLLWKEEALKILEERKRAEGFRHRPRESVYARLTEVLDSKTLKRTVSEVLLSRERRPGAQPMSGGG